MGRGARRWPPPQPDWPRPPSLAAWLLTRFAPAQHAESILGDLLEEFSPLASTSGLAFARSWYWRQTLKTIAHLARAGFRAAPWSTAAAVAAGALLIRCGLMAYGHAMEAVLDRYRVYEYVSDLGRRQPSLNVAAAYMFWITRGTLIGRVLVEALAGGIVAVASRGRELTVAIALALFLGALGVAGCLLMAATTGDYEFLFLWALPSVFADSMAIVVGGAIVRTLRARASAATTRPSTT
jgi:hypothetical protein